MLNRTEDAIIEKIIREYGLSEQDCLDGLTDQQARAWVRYALLLEPIPQIREELFGHRKNCTDSTVLYVLHEAVLRIWANLLRDAELMYEAKKKPGIRKLQKLIDRVRELRKIKGAKIKCRSRRSVENN